MRALGPDGSSSQVKTTWMQLDNEFYEARGACWALLHFLKAVEIDFNDVLENKNAKVSVQQIVRELEASQQSLWSPMILNGELLQVLHHRRQAHLGGNHRAIGQGRARGGSQGVLQQDEHAGPAVPAQSQ